MKHRRKAILLTLSLLMAACGGAPDSRSVSGSTTTAPTIAPTTTSTPNTSTTAAPTTTLAPSTTAVAIGCGAAGLPSQPAEQDLPDAVSSVRNAIVAAAVKCDFDTLAEIAGDQFTYSFGGGNDPAGFWRELEKRSATAGEVSPLTMMVRLLDLPYGTMDLDTTTLYVWPSAHAYDSWEVVPEADRQALLDVYGAQDLDDFAEFGGYVGYRFGITDGGDWMFFVAGD